MVTAAQHKNDSQPTQRCQLDNTKLTAPPPPPPNQKKKKEEKEKKKRKVKKIKKKKKEKKKRHLDNTEVRTRQHQGES